MTDMVAELSVNPINLVLMLLFCVILLSGNHAEAAEVYVWIDEQGNQHFGDRPPDDAVQQDVDVTRETYEIENVDTGYPITDPNLHLDQSESYTDKKRRERMARDEHAKAKRSQMEKACQDARVRLSKIKGPVNYYDANGDPIKVTERERRQEQIDLTAAVQEHCS